MDNKDIKAMLFGYMIGDGWISKGKNSKGIMVYQSGFSGDICSLKIIKDDLIKCFGNIGKAKISSNQTFSPKYNISGTTNKFSCTQNVTKEFIKLGMPTGRRVEKEFLLPDWIVNGSYDIKKNFISGLYSAEGTTPQMQINDRTLKPLTLCLTKRIELKENLIEFMNQVIKIINDLGIDCSAKYVKTFTCAENIKCTISINNNVENIIKAINMLDLRYCERKMEEIIILKFYYKERQAMLDKLALAYEEAMMENSSPSKIARKYSITTRQVLKWKERRTGFRIPNTFPKYSDFAKMQRPLLSTINSVKQGKNSNEN